MSDKGGAAAALANAVIAALKGVPGLSQVADGMPMQAADACAVVEIGPETDWGHKSGGGAELRFAVRIDCAGERPERARVLLERARAAVERLVAVEGWQLVTLTVMRARALRLPGGRWSGVAEYRARMLRL